MIGRKGMCDISEVTFGIKMIIKKHSKDKLKSCICTQEQLQSKKFTLKKFPTLTEIYPDFNIPHNILHRKNWEFAFIINALSERGMIKKGKKGLGFAVGVEPLPTYFASKGCRILATDLWDSGTNSWIESGQNANGNYCLLNKYHFLSDKKFNQLVEYKNLDMNEIPNELNSFDFCWSSCAMEHVGSLELSKNFIKNMLSTLKPGGIAVHTTEFNLSSNVDTITEGDSILWREKDIEEVRDWLEANGHFIEVDFNNGIMEGDRFIDRPPYYLINPKYHLHLDILGYESTSFGFIIVKSK